MPKEGTFWVPLGYTPVWRWDATGSVRDQLMQLREVLGYFETISFQTNRLGEKTFQVIISRRGMVPPQDHKSSTINVIEEVSGMLGDKLILKSGETLVIEQFSQSRFELELRFLSNK